MPEPPNTEPPSTAPEEALLELRALRAGAHEAARRLRRLRQRTRELEAENERLKERVDELERSPAASHDGSALRLDDDPEALRKQIDDFIETLNAELE